MMGARGDRLTTAVALVAASAVLMVAGCTSTSPRRTPSPTRPPHLEQTLDCTGPIGSGSTLGEVAAGGIDGGVMALTGGAPGSPTDPIQLADDVGPGRFRFAKIGIAIKTGESFTLSVPQRWRGRMRIGWGNRAFVSAGILHVPGCAAVQAGASWVVYPGGFELKTAACVPLVIQSATGTRTIHVPIGTRCP